MNSFGGQRGRGFEVARSRAAEQLGTAKHGGISFCRTCVSATSKSTHRVTNDPRITDVFEVLSGIPRFADTIQQLLPAIGTIRADPQEKSACADRRAGVGIGAKLIFGDHVASLW